MRTTLAVSTFLLAVAVTLPVQARGKNESHISYDDGGTIVRQGEDGQEVDARVNLPVFPGDEVITNRRGRAEVRLADGNVVAIDRATAIQFKSVLNSYDGDSNDTIAELHYGKVAIYRSADAQESLRLDTQSASYFAGNEASFSVESDSRGVDRVQVFDGTIEVRTPSKSSRVRAGESADIDDRGLYNLTSDDGRSSADDFERWFLQRAEHYGSSSSRYLDSSLAYSDQDLAQHGAWTFMGGYGWGWRPFVGAGWRPYYYGQWAHGASGCLTWVSYEPWGWVPYHYGRWSYDPTYGWFWLPGSSYAPAWVYWWYSPGYVGWAPAGWYDCYRPYYDWAYRPYRGGIDFGFGFYGRVRVHDVDLRPWTFIDANTILSTRVDRAALSTDIVRARLAREPGGLATISGNPARFSRNELRDPAGAVDAIYRRGIAGGGPSAGSAGTDMTPFFRRDPELPVAIRDRMVRTRPADGGVPSSRIAGSGGGGVAPIGGGSVAPIGRGSVAPIGTGSVAPTNNGDGHINRGDSGSWRGNNNSGTVERGGETPRDNNNGHVNRGSGDTPSNNENRATDPSWRGRVTRAFPGGAETGDRPSGTTAPAPAHDDNWRGRVARDEPGGTDAPPRGPGRSRSVDRGSSDVPRRVIDGIGGTRIYRGDDRPSGHDPAPPPPRAPDARPPARNSAPPPQHHDSSKSGSSGNSGKSGSSGQSSSHNESGHADKNKG